MVLFTTITNSQKGISDSHTWAASLKFNPYFSLLFLLLRLGHIRFVITAVTCDLLVGGLRDHQSLVWFSKLLKISKLPYWHVLACANYSSRHTHPHFLAHTRGRIPHKPLFDILHFESREFQFSPCFRISPPKLFVCTWCKRFAVADSQFARINSSSTQCYRQNLWLITRLPNGIFPLPSLYL